MTLSSLLARVSQYMGIAHKEDIAQLAAALPPLPDGWHPIGDDAAAVPTADGFTLLAVEGFLNAFVKADPWFAGWCGVMVNVSDITAMGGRPTAVVNALWNNDAENAQQIIAGMAAAANTFGVPIIGGHTNLRANQPQLSVSILGHANTLLSAFSARPGQSLVVAVDLRGAFRAPYLNWNAATEAPPQRLRADLALLPEIAEQGLATAAKDISQAGLLGTLLMLLESSAVGASIDLEAIPRPNAVDWLDWLCAFPSFGYLLAADSQKLPELLAKFHARDIAAAAIGEITAGSELWVRHGDEEALFRDLAASPLTGFTPSKSPLNQAKDTALCLQ